MLITLTLIVLNALISSGNPLQASTNLLGNIVSEIRFDDLRAASGYWIGFFSYLEYLIAAQAAQCPVFAELVRFNASAAMESGLPSAPDGPLMAIGYSVYKKTPSSANMFYVR